MIGLGASAGGIDPLRRILGRLPGDLDAAILVVLHVSAASRSVLAQILDRSTDLEVRPATTGDRLEPGVVLVAQPDRHLMVKDDVVVLNEGPRENGHRPALDPLFRSMAEFHDGDCCAVVLSGTRDDGTDGLAVVKRCGGLAIAQDPDEATYDGMPRSAISNVPVDAVLTADAIADALQEFVTAGAIEAPDPPAPDALPDLPIEPQLRQLVCPECGGVMTEDGRNGVLVFRCHTGHRYSPESLIGEQSEATERALWAAIRALEERAMTMRRMAEHAELRGTGQSAKRFRRQADAAEREADEIKKVAASFAEQVSRAVAEH